MGYPVHQRFLAPRCAAAQRRNPSQNCMVDPQIAEIAFRNLLPTATQEQSEEWSF
jgi:hypothetical protein